MKNFVLSFIISIFFVSASAQVTKINGTVNDNNGNPIHFAFVQDKQFKTGTYTDSLGNFSIDVNPSSKLYVNCYGFKDTTIDVLGKPTLHIVLRSFGKLTNEEMKTKDVSGNSNFAVEDAFAPHSLGQHNLVATNQGSMFPQFSIKEQTQGSRYLYTSWSHGYVINSADSVVQSPSFSFNYDKIGGGLLLSQDKNAAIEVNRNQVKGFTLYDNANIAATFENIPTIDATHYVQVLSGGSKYKIYKLIKTKFVKADYSTNGISSTGNNFDEYIDEGTYFVYNVKTAQYQKIELKKKSLKVAFSQESDKINKYITDHSSEDINDTYLLDLGLYMNQ